jgi:hypothetical protein
MPYPALDPGKIGPGMPLDISNLENLYRGANKTNGFLMRSVDGRIPALQQPIGRMAIAAVNTLSDDDIVPWGNALWRDIATIDTRPGIAHAEKPTAGILAGILKFNQGWQAGNPVAPHGVPSYSRGTIVTQGLVGYKTAMTAVGQEDNYLSYLKGVAAQDIPAVRTIYTDWVATYKVGADGDRLGLFFGNASGFPIVALVAKANQAAPTLTGATFAGFAEIFEKENGAIFFGINS